MSTCKELSKARETKSPPSASEVVQILCAIIRS